MTYQPELKVLYDGGCPVCSREIAVYRWLDRAQRVAWLDIAHASRELADLGVKPAEAMAIFHVVDPEGRIIRGVDAFLTLWRVLPGYRWLASAVDRLRLQPLLNWSYRHFLRWRAKRGRCTEESCS